MVLPSKTGVHIIQICVLYSNFYGKCMKVEKYEFLIDGGKSAMMTILLLMVHLFRNLLTADLVCDIQVT